jgi:TolB-like protein/class 3 adenylate cyclase/Tfp pilus assembly protein PilF
LAAILAADVVGYSRLVEQDEAGTLAALKKLRAEVIDPLLAKHKGRIVKLMGDGAIVEFGSVVDAVACAVAVQKDTAAAQACLPSGRRIVFRIGVNLGDVVVEGDDLLGDGVNVAARLEQLCDPGSVLISGTACDHLQGKLGLPLDFAGEQQVKNISRPVRAYRVRLDGRGQPWRLRLRPYLGKLRLAAAALIGLVLLAGGLWWARPVEPAKPKPSIAVLPFDNLGGDETTGRLADGITEDVITDLARFRALDVIARNSIMIYKGKPVDVRQVGRDLNARYILEGSIQQQAGRVRVTAQLIDASSGSHVWSERWDRSAADIFVVQTELAEHVSDRLGGYSGTVIAADREAAKRKRPANLTAYDLYLLGIEAQRRGNQTSVEEATQLLKRSLDIDPGLARAWTSLAFSYALLQNWADDSSELRRLQLDASRRAVELDPLDAYAHAALGDALAATGGLAEAEAEYGKALALNPGSADILTLYSGWASTFGEPQEGMEAAEHAMRLNPNVPAWAYINYRWAFFMGGRYEQAAKMQERRPRENYGRSDFVEGAAILAALGRSDEAKAAVTEALAQFPDVTVEGYAGSLGMSAAERQRLVETMKKAGFPVCAGAAELRATPQLVRLPECVTAQATN